MLNQKFDMLALGHNYLSYLYALDLIRQGKNVALIDDPRLNYGELYMGQLSQLEKNFLQQWGVDKKIEPFINLDRYLEIDPYTVILGEKRIRLGDQACRNYLELARKLPFCFLSSKSVKKQFSRQNYMASFDNAFEELSWKITEHFYRSEKTQHMKMGALLENAPQVISQIYKDFAHTINNENEITPDEMWTMRTFLYVLRGYHQVKLSYQYTPLQLFHFLLGLISPNYRVDSKRLIGDLHQDFLDKGGKYKKTHLVDWRFHRSRPWRVQLNSFEGILRPKRIALFAGSLESLPVKVVPKELVYRCLKVEWSLSSDIGLSDGRVVYSSIDKIGTDQSIWEMNIINSKLIRFNVFFLAEEGLKISFIEQSVRKMLLNDLKHIHYVEEEQILKEHVEFGDEVWIEDRSANKSTVNLKKSDSLPFMLYDTSHSDAHLEGVSYYGPKKATEFGLLSSMMEIKRQAKSL